MHSNRRGFIRSVALASGAALISSRAYGRQANQPPGLRPIRRNVGVFIGPGGTIAYLASRDGSVVVDSQFPATAGRLLDGLRDLTGPNPRWSFLINTHHHGDHTAGNVTLRPAVQQIVQHERCAASHRLLLQNADAAAQAGAATVTFSDRWSVEIGDERVTARHFAPAHTGGDAIVVFERANIVHIGDLVFNRVPPFVDRAAGASIRSWIGVLEQILDSYRDATFVFGHGKDNAVTGTASDVSHFRDFLAAAMDHVQRGITSGQSEKEIVSAGQLRGFPEFSDAVKDYPSAFPRFTIEHVLAAAYQETQ